METLFEKPLRKSRINKVMIVGALVGIALIAGLVLIAMRRPSMDDQKAAILADAMKEDSPVFKEVTKDIIISTGDNTVESPNALWTISMFITGKIRNKGDKTINGLEVNVAVVDTFNNVLKEKRVLVVPTQVALLGPGDSIPITLSLDGFSKKDDRANIRWKVTAIRLAN